MIIIILKEQILYYFQIYSIIKLNYTINEKTNKNKIINLKNKFCIHNYYGKINEYLKKLLVC